jgi:mannan endo-1,4-beta-mannosidase
MAFGSGLGLYHVLGVASCVALVYFSLGELDIHPLSFSLRSSYAAPTAPFVERRGARLFLDGRPFYVNGWNSYWLMDQAVEMGTRHRVSRMFRDAADMGLTVCRTWAFNDGAYNALQLAPGHFDHRVFKVINR